jgi:hypothetical protein
MHLDFIHSISRQAIPPCAGANNKRAYGHISKRGHQRLLVREELKIVVTFEHEAVVTLLFHRVRTMACAIILVLAFMSVVSKFTDEAPNFQHLFQIAK